MSREYPCEVANRVDVLIAVKSPAPWLEQTLRSIVQQTLPDWNLVLVMDGQSPEVEQLCRLYVPHCVPISVDPGSGTVRALMAGLERSNGSLIARIDADDVALPDRFRTQVGFLDRHPECVAVATGFQRIDEAGTILSTHPLALGDPIRRLRWYNPLVQSSMMLRRSAVEAAGGYDPAARHLEDYDLWLRLAGVGAIGVIPEPLVQYRIHADQVTRRFGYTHEARRTLRASRVRLAEMEGRSLTAAKIRQQAWDAVNRIKGR